MEKEKGKIMFGLMRKSRHEKICSNLHSHIKHYGEINRKHGSEIEEMNIQSLFWEEDGIVYEMTSLGADVDKEGLIEMAKEVIAQ